MSFHLKTKNQYWQFSVFKLIDFYRSQKIYKWVIFNIWDYIFITWTNWKYHHKNLLVQCTFNTRYMTIAYNSKHQKLKKATSTNTIPLQNRSWNLINQLRLIKFITVPGCRSSLAFETRYPAQGTPEAVITRLKRKHKGDADTQREWVTSPSCPRIKLSLNFKSVKSVVGCGAGDLRLRGSAVRILSGRVKKGLL